MMKENENMMKEEIRGTDNFLPGYDDVLLPKDLQKILHAGRNTIYKCLADGTIPSLRMGGKYLIPKLYLKDFIYSDKLSKAGT